MIYGYARFLADGLSIEAQVRELTDAGCEKVVRETPVGARTNRAQLGRLQSVLGPGDVLVVTRLDRLARSTRDLLKTLAGVTDSGADFRSLAESWADTTASRGSMLVAVLGGITRFERQLLTSRTTEGRNLAKARGIRMGRKPKLTHNQRREAIERRVAGEKVTDIARSYKVSHSTISRLAPISPAATPLQSPPPTVAGLDR